MTEPSTETVEALARVLRSVGVEIGYAGADTYRTVVAERILADPGPLLAALAEAGVLEKQERPRQRDRWTLEILREAQRRYVTAWEATNARP